MDEFLQHLKDSFRNLLPIVAVVALFQLAVMREVPDGLAEIVFGMGLVVVGLALFLQGLELSVFPVARNLSDEFARRGSLPLLIFFGFCLGFSAVIAEPALIAVAEQAQSASGGRIDALTLRLLVALSVGAVVAIGVLRILLGHTVHLYMIAGCLLVGGVTFFAPAEIVGLAYDSGGVTTNVITAPLIVSFGVGLAASLRGRNALMHGFGLLGMVVLMPMLMVQLYGIYVYSFVDEMAVAVSVGPEPAAPAQNWQVLGMAGEIARMFLDVLPIVAVIVGFQYLVLRRHLAHVRRVVTGFVMVVLGLYAFMLGLELGLFPLGERMAVQLAGLDTMVFIYLFAFLTGLAATMAEPALIAVGEQAEEAARGRLRASHVRLAAALGIACGITLGAQRIVSGGDFHLYFIGIFAVLICFTLLAPKYIVALSYDVGGAGSTAINVPLLTALGMGLASQIEGRSTLIDGFGLIAFATMLPVATVMLYAIIAERFARPEKGESS
ncbi:MAG TPA: DUF1538 domain-containing protein [Azoarcus sp.]|nr:DUF1538 domain-containing protein [Azoarcus sp.]